MERVRICLALLLASLVIWPQALSYAAAADAEPMTKAEFADILIRILELEMPQGTEGLSDTEIFKIQAKMLAERGIRMFVGEEAEADDLVSLGDFADVLYDALMGPNNALLEGKIAYLIQQGYIVLEPGFQLDEPMRKGDILSALNIPELYDAVAEAYSRPGPGRLGRAIGPLGRVIPPAPYNPENRFVVEAEIPASPIMP